MSNDQDSIVSSILLSNVSLNATNVLTNRVNHTGTSFILTLFLKISANCAPYRSNKQHRKVACLSTIFILRETIMISKDLRLLGDSDWQVGRRWHVPLHTPVIFSVHRVPDLAYSLVFTRVCVTWAFHVTFNQHISSIFL